MAAPVIVIVIALWLASRVGEQPLTRVEKVVTLDAVSK